MPVSVKRFRLISLIEGISYLGLLYFMIHHKRFLVQEDAIRRPDMAFCLSLGHPCLNRSPQPFNLKSKFLAVIGIFRVCLFG